MSSHLTPIEVCERLIGPIADLGRIAGLAEKSAYRWRGGSAWRDPGDISPRANRKLLAYASARCIPLTEKHLIWGAPAQEIDALLETMNGRRHSKKVAAE